MPTVGPAEVLLTGLPTLFWIVLVVALVVGIGRLVVRRVRREDPAMDALRSRYARGEIDDAEYERLRTTLQRG